MMRKIDSLKYGDRLVHIIHERPRPYSHLLKFPLDHRHDNKQMPSSSKKKKKFVVPELSAEERANLPELPTEVWYRITDILIRQRCKVMCVFTLCKATAELAKDARLIDARIDALKTKNMDRVCVLVMWINEGSLVRGLPLRMVTALNDALLRIYADPLRRPANTKGARDLLKIASEYRLDSTVKILLQLYPPHPGDTAALERAVALGGSPIPGMLKTAYGDALNTAFMRGSYDVACLLISAGASLANAGIMLRWAAKDDHLGLVELLLDTVCAKPFEDRVLQRSDDDLFAEDSDYAEDFDEAVSDLSDGAEITSAGPDKYVVRTSRIPSLDEFREAEWASTSSRVRDMIRYYKQRILPNA